MSQESISAATSKAPGLEALLLARDEVFARGVTDAFERDGIAVTVAFDDEAGLELAASERFAVVLLDAPADPAEAFELCRRARMYSDAPLLVLSGPVSRVDPADVLEAGADDAVKRPLQVRELAARVRALARRTRWHARPPPAIRVGALEVDGAARRASLGGRELTLTRYQFALLKVLATHAGTVLSRERLMEEAKGSADEAFDRSVDVQVCHLRTKLGDDSRHPRMLKTVRGCGYVLVVPES
ncbi:MAG TPA: response regulator transcription factor [Gemmatimonadales bacterium]|nr:response regulator transcription factor [Gemmatimonadales bacterium]